ncbi:MAG: VCBS repeat-containing protein [Clostridiales bacterium]|nr:VCBS repeat-containing protein [Clostridiales bacterium]
MGSSLKKRLIPALLAVVLSLSLTGCNSILGMDVENKLRPPRAAGEQAEIQKALDSYLHENKLPSNYVLKYPRSGEYRSAFIMKDINGDQVEEALALYLPGEKAGAIHLNLLQRVEGKWTSVSDTEGVSTDIDSITFGDLDGDGHLEIFAGWNRYTDTQQLVMYSLSGGELIQSYAETNYNKIIVGDIRKTGHDDLLLLRIQPDDKTVTARLLADQEGVVIEIGAVDLDMSVQRLGDAHVCSLTETVNGIFVDGITTGEGMITELICWNGEILTTPFSEHDGSAKLTFRTMPVPSMDIDGDGLVEWPRTDIVSAADGSENTTAGGTAEVFYTRWLTWDYEHASTTPRDYGFVNLAEGYMFRTEKAWEGQITVVYNRESRTTDFYRVDEDGEKWFLSLRTSFVDQAGSEEDYRDFEPLTTIGNVRYEGALIKDPPFSLNKEDLLRRIKALPL